MAKSEREWSRDDSWLDSERAFISEEPETTPPVYDLEERTARLGEIIIDFARKIPRSPLTDRITGQLVGAGTSVGANYVEADDSVSKKEFLKCIGTGKKEARETKHFLRMVARAVPELQTDARELWLEAKGVAFDFRENLANRKRKGLKMLPKRFPSLCLAINSALIRHSSFVIGHFYHVCLGR